jgi:regulatory protein
MLSRKRRPKTKKPAEQASDQGEIGAAAIALLSRRDFCSGELTQRLREQGFTAAAVHSVVSDLIEQRFVDDARYANNYVSYHAERGHGPARIRRDLLVLDVDQGVIDAALADGRDWAQAARELRIRKFGLSVPRNWRAKAKQARFLQYRGFSADHIRSALGPDLDLD